MPLAEASLDGCEVKVGRNELPVTGRWSARIRQGSVGLLTAGIWPNSLGVRELRCPYVGDALEDRRTQLVPGLLTGMIFSSSLVSNGAKGG